MFNFESYYNWRFKLSLFLACFVVAQPSMVIAASYSEILESALATCNSVPSDKIRVIVAPAVPVSEVNYDKEISIVGMLPDYPNSKYIVAMARPHGFIEAVEAGKINGIQGYFRVYFTDMSDTVAYQKDSQFIAVIDIESSRLPLRLHARLYEDIDEFVAFSQGPTFDVPGGSCSVWGLLVAVK